jgi:hypothetical protein
VFHDLKNVKIAEKVRKLVDFEGWGGGIKIYITLDHNLRRGLDF